MSIRIRTAPWADGMKPVLPERHGLSLVLMPLHFDAGLSAELEAGNGVARLLRGCLASSLLAPQGIPAD